MDNKVSPSVVRFLNTTDKAVVGSGLLVEEKRIITCAHVVLEALDFPQLTQAMPKKDILIDFPFSAIDKTFKANVQMWCPVQDSFARPMVGEDVAKLEMIEDPPSDAQAAHLKTSRLRGHLFDTLGFPKHHNKEGSWTSGELSGKLVNGWIQVQGLRTQGYAIEPGFSGSPVWDKNLGAIVGLVIASDVERSDAKVGFIIPTNVLSIVLSKPNLNIVIEHFESLRNQFVDIASHNADQGEISSEEWKEERQSCLLTTIEKFINTAQLHVESLIEKSAFDVEIPKFALSLDSKKDLLKTFTHIRESPAETIVRSGIGGFIGGIRLCCRKLLRENKAEETNNLERAHPLLNTLLSPEFWDDLESPEVRNDLRGAGLLGNISTKIVRKIMAVDERQRTMDAIKNRSNDVFSLFMNGLKQYIKGIELIINKNYYQ